MARVRVRLDVAYRGTGLHGWAKQEGLATVQGYLEDALALVCREPIALTVAGRTDAGVHARGQVAHADLPGEFWYSLAPRGKKAPSQFAGSQICQDRAGASEECAAGRIDANPEAEAHPKRMEQGAPDDSRAEASLDSACRSEGTAHPPLENENGALPVAPPLSGFSSPLDEWRCTTLRRRLAGLVSRASQGAVALKKITLVNADFDARFSALWRQYCYRISDQGWVDPTRLNVAFSPRPLDVETMHTAAQAFVGEHDFLPFAKPREGATTIRTLHSFHVQRAADGLIEAQIRADAFCHSQVRFMMGALMAVGSGARAPEWIAHLLERGVKDNAVPLAPGEGLTLEAVGYPEPEHWAAQASQARVLRTELGMTLGMTR